MSAATQAPIGERLAALRRSAGLRKLDIATATGVHVRTIGDIESGRRTPTRTTLARIEVALGVREMTDRERLLHELRDDVRAGRVETRSTEWYRRREQARWSDPEYRERKNEETRRRYYERRAKRDAAAAHVRALRTSGPGIDRPSMRSQIERRTAARRMARASCEPKIKQLKREEIERLDAVVVQIKAAETPACPATTMRGGFRVACILRGEHAGHVGVHGDRW
jgi:transcriptional regulator with XRE-family HTH domain